MTEEKRGSIGGKKRAEKLSKEERKRIASEAAKARWAKKKTENTAIVSASKDSDYDGTVTISFVNSKTGEISLPSPVQEAIITPEAQAEKHCPACLAGQSLEEGDGEHILATVEHPVALPAAFDDSKMQEVVQAPTTPPAKPAKVKSKNLPKEFKTASSYAEKRLPVAIKEKSEHVAKVAQLDAEINDLVRVIKALGGNADAYASQAQNFPGVPYQPVSYAPNVPVLPAPYAEYQRPPITQNSAPAPATPPTTVSVPKPMKMGGAGALDFSGIIND